MERLMKHQIKPVIAAFILALVLLPISPVTGQELSPEFVDRGYIDTSSIGFYISAAIGMVKMSNLPITGGAVTSTLGASLLVAVGYGFDLFRIELEYGGSAVPIDTFRHFVHPHDVDGFYGNGWLVANAYYDYKNNSSFTPYFGLGLGYATNFYDPTNIDGKDCSNCRERINEFAFQIKAGVTYAISNSFDAFGGFRFLYTDTLRSNGGDLGIRYNF
jgi:opacity protein-like surface antigen